MNAHKSATILFLDQFDDLGGAQACLLDLVPAIRARDWSVQVALPGLGKLAEKLTTAGAAVHILETPRYNGGFKTIGDAFRLFSSLRRQAGEIRELAAATGCHLLYVNGPRLLPAAALATLHTPVVFHAHNRLHGPALVAARRSLRRLDAEVVACSRYVAEPLRVSRNLTIVPNGVAGCEAVHRSFSNSPTFRIGLIGRIAPEKGHLEFVQAVALLCRRFPRLKFVVCGAPMFGDRRYYPSVIQAAQGLPIDFLGWRDDINSVLRDLDLLVIPSRDEGLPRVMLEAFSAALPVIAYSTGGIPEALVDGETGFLVTRPSPLGLADAITSLLDLNPLRLRRVARNARLAWESSYSLSRYQAGVTAVLERLLGSAPRPDEGSAMHPSTAPLQQ